MNRYLVLIAYAPRDWSTVTEAEEADFERQHRAFETFVDEHGRRISSAALADVEAATTVRHENGRPVISDGPFAELAEMIGGYYDVELPDLDTAIAAVGLLPPSYTLEIRPTIVIDGFE